MSFDKTKAMRNAEKYVAQGKIRLAISEYQSVVAHDPRDITTMNMLGDLHAKTSERRQAVECYMKVAEHYATQGFAQKAIAIYNKVARLQPDSIEVSTKLAELYKVKGSLSEARSHYETLAKHFEASGKRIEALAMWKQIALLDPNNTEVCVNLAESYLKEGQAEDAAEAFAEAGGRFGRHGAHEDAIKMYHRSLDIQPDALRTLDGLIHSYSALGRVSKAVEFLEGILEKEPYNRDILYLLIDCHIDSQNAAGAERAVLKLVEIEPANYPKLLDLVRLYLNTNDLDSAARILSMSSEYLLAGGQADECKRWIDEILGHDPSHVPALRLLVRYSSWIKDEEAFRISLERLAVSARAANEADDERFALSQLVVVRPFETQFSERLAELKELHGFSDDDVDAELLRAGFDQPATVVAEMVAAEDHTPVVVEPAVEEPAPESAVFEVEQSNGFVAEAEAPVADENKLAKDLESISFYLDNEYHELAAKAIDEVEKEFGERPEIVEVKKRVAALRNKAASHHELTLEDMRSEFGLTDELPSDEDYDTKYHTAIAYQEMGLTEDAIRIFQEAITLVSPLDGTRRFFHCANLLGHCFMATGHASMAATWFSRALETPNLDDSERHGLWYELATAYDAAGNSVDAQRFYEQVYTENVDFRDVATRVRSELAVH